MKILAMKTLAIKILAIMKAYLGMISRVSFGDQKLDGGVIIIMFHFIK
jgi:hypothetical protein